MPSFERESQQESQNGQSQAIRVNNRNGWGALGIFKGGRMAKSLFRRKIFLLNRHSYYKIYLILIKILTCPAHFPI